jgi:hypothetical protein
VPRILSNFTLRVLNYSRTVTIPFGYILDCGYVTCTVAVSNCFVMCGSFDNMCTCFYGVLYCLHCVFFVSVYFFLFVLSVLV